MIKLNLLEILTYDFAEGKTCVKGRSCGLTCISKSDDCLEDFPPEIRSAVKTLAGRMSEQYGGSKGADTDRAKMLDVLKVPSENFKKLLEGKSEEEQVYWSEMMVLSTGKQRDKSEKFQYSDQEALGLNERSEALSAAWRTTKEAGFTPEGLRTPGGIAEYVRNQRNVDVSDEDVEMFWNSVSPELRGNLAKMGDAKGKYWEGDNLDTEAIPTAHGKASEMRGKMLMKIYLQQGGRDLYTGQRLPLQEADLEHIIPLSRGLENSEDPANWGLIRTGINAGRADKDLDVYVSEALNKNLKIKPGEQPDQKTVESLRAKWIKNEEKNIAKREAKAAAEGTDWSAADKDTFDAALNAFTSQKKPYNMVLAIAGKENVSTTMELPGTPAQIVNQRRGRDYWLTVGVYKTGRLPKDESIATYTAKAWRDGSPAQRAAIEKFWKETQMEATRAWQDSDVLSDPKTAKKNAQLIAAEVIKQRTEELMDLLEN